MSLYLLVPGEIAGHPLARDLCKSLGARERLAEGEAQAVIQAFRESAGGALSRFQSWSLLEVELPDPERLAILTKAVRQQISREGRAVLDLETSGLTLAEVQEVAARIGLTVGLVAVLMPPPAGDAAIRSPDLDTALLAALGEFGGAVSLTELRRRVERAASEVRNHLDTLVSLGKVVRISLEGQQIRYGLPGQAGHWMESKILELLAGGPLGSSQICQYLQTSYGKLIPHLSEVLRQGLIVRSGSGFKTKYQLSPEGGACSGTSA